MKTKNSLSTMTLAALGIVYGDIGTSPLYTLKESFAASKLTTSETNVFGFVSLIIWALLLVVTLKYILFILRADNKGEGGVVILMQEALRHVSGRTAAFVTLAGLCGTALFYGDAVITPAISVLSAAEGLIVINSSFEHWVLPLSISVLLLLFWIQRHGTQRIGIFFGPIMLLWFSTLAAIGLYQLLQYPHILMAANPYYGINFIAHNGWHGFVSLGAIVLAVTGAEALYADMGHFGRKPIQTAWLGLVLPALALNYIGQGALLLRLPESISNPFFLAAPKWGLIPLIMLATLATVIASQAVISGAYSLTRQAIQLGLLPRMRITHTSSTEIGQIYLPAINWILLVIVMLVVLGFRNSTNLAAAYGIAATGTMVFTTLMFAVVLRKNWRWPLWATAGLTAVFLAFDLTFLSSNLLKLPNGGWFPILVAAIVIFILTTWRKGRNLLHYEQQSSGLNLKDLVNNLTLYPPLKVEGNAIFMTSNSHTAPRALLHNLKHNKIVHYNNFFLFISTEDVPRVPEEQRLEIQKMAPTFSSLHARYGFQETPDVIDLIELARKKGLDLEMMETSFFLSRDSIVITANRPLGSMNRVRTVCFQWLYKNSTPATAYYNIPTNRVVELGTQVTL